MSDLNQNFALPVTVRVHWLSEELSALADARHGRCTTPLMVTAWLAEDEQGQWQAGVEDPYVTEEFVASLRSVLVDAPEAPIHLTPFLRQLTEMLPMAVEAVLRERIAAGVTLNGPVEVALRLPALDRKTWRVRAALLPSIRLILAGGSLYGAGAESGASQAAAALASTIALPVVGMRESCGLSFTFRERVTGERLQRLRGALRHYHFGPECEAAFAAKAETGAYLEFQMNLPAAAVQRWCAVPDEADATFMPAWSRVTHAVQRSMRRWLPVMAVRDAADLARLDMAPSVLAYGLTRSYAGKSKTQMTYDVLNDESVRIAHACVARALPSVLPQLCQAVANAGLAEARHYRPLRAAEFLTALKHDQRVFPSLLQLDGLLWNDLLAFGVKAKKIRVQGRREPQKALIDAVRSGEEFGRRFQRRISALLPHVDLSSLLSLALLEATAALAPSDERRAVVTIDNTTFVSRTASAEGEQPLAA